MVPAARIVRTGLLGAAVLLYLAFVGLLSRFADLDLVGGWVTMTRLLLIGVPIGVGYLVLAPRVEAGSLVAPGGPRAFLSSAAAGAVGGLALGLIVLLMDGFGLDRIRPILIQVSPDLVDAIDFGLGPTVGAVVLAVVGIFGGLAGAGIRLAPEAVRRRAITGVSAVLLFGLLQRIVPIAMAELRLETSWLYVRSGGLTWIGAAVVLVLALVIRELWRTRGRGFRSRLTAGEGTTGRDRALVFGALLVVALIAPLALGSVISEVLGSVMVYALLGLGLNIVVGFAGLLDLGYVAFYAFGAYAMALFSGALLNTTSGVSKAPAISFQLDFFVAIVIVAVGAALLGLLIGGPVLRLRGDYLAIVTLGLGEIVSIIATSKWAEPLVGGPQGMRGVTKAAIFGLNPQDTPQHFYYLALVFVLFAFFISRRLANSRIGRAWNAMREDEQVADAMGVNTTRFKLLAFAIGGAIGSLGGSLFAVSIGSVTPASFEVLVSITALAVVILGGLGSLPGVVVGALVLIGLPGLLREFEEYRLLIYGGSLVLIMILRPQGLIPNLRRTRELKEEERSQDAWARGAQERADDRADNLDEIVAGGRLGVEREDLT